MAYIDPADMIAGSPLPGWSGRFFHSQNMTFALWDIAADAVPLHEHHHEQEEVWNVVDGEIDVAVDGDRRRVTAGMAVVVPPDVPHSVTPVGPCRVVVTDWPVREHLPGVG